MILNKMFAVLSERNVHSNLIGHFWELDEDDYHSLSGLKYKYSLVFASTITEFCLRTSSDYSYTPRSH